MRYKYWVYMLASLACGYLFKREDYTALKLIFFQCQTIFGVMAAASIDWPLVYSDMKSIVSDIKNWRK